MCLIFDELRDAVASFKRPCAPVCSVSRTPDPCEEGAVCPPKGGGRTAMPLCLRHRVCTFTVVARRDARSAKQCSCAQVQRNADGVRPRGAVRCPPVAHSRLMLAFLETRLNKRARLLVSSLFRSNRFDVAVLGCLTPASSRCRRERLPDCYRLVGVAHAWSWQGCCSYARGYRLLPRFEFEPRVR